MANRGSIGAIKTEVNANIRQNGEGAITGNILNGVITDLIDTLNYLLSLFLTQENGFFIADNDKNVALKYDENGLDFATISSHAIQVLKEAGLGGGGDFVVDVVEDGFYFIDSQYNVGAKIDANGLHSINVLEYEIINS